MMDKDEKLELLVQGAKMGIEQAIALARRGALSLSPGPTDDPDAFPYSVPLHPRAEAYIASQETEHSKPEFFDNAYKDGEIGDILS